MLPALHRLTRVLGFALLLVGTPSARAQAVPDFSALDWTPLTQSGVVLTDPSGDTAIAPARDVVGCNASTPAGQTCAPSAPGAFVSSDASFLYVRLRIAATPNLASDGYGCEIDTDGNDHNYEFFLLAGKNGVQLWQNTIGRTDSPSDTADVLLQSYTPASSYQRAVAAADLGSFIDAAVAWSDLAGASVAQTTLLRFVCGANSNGAPTLTSGTSADLLGDETAGSTLWHVLASDLYECGYASACIACPNAPFPAFASADNATFTTGQANSFHVLPPYGCPLPTVSTGGVLPTGVTFDPATNILSGAPDATTGGVYPLTLTASNGVPDDLVQNFTLTVVLSDTIFKDDFDGSP